MISQWYSQFFAEDSDIKLLKKIHVKQKENTRFLIEKKKSLSRKI